MEKQSAAKLYLSVILAMIFFSLSFVWFKIANLSYGPLTIILFRLVISSVVLFFITRLSGRLVLPGRKDFRYLLLLAFFGIIIVIAGLFIAQFRFKKSYVGPDPIPRT